MKMNMIFSISWALILVRNVLCIAEAVWDSDGHCWLFSICDHFGNNLVGANTFPDSFFQLQHHQIYIDVSFCTYIHDCEML